jgi:outer membrane receptor for ferrienterochelin and colicins
MHQFFVKYILVCVLSLLVFTSKAQNTLKVFDAKTLETLPYAHAQLTNKLGKIHKTISNENGEIEFPYDFEGDIDVQISYVGYQTFVKQINPLRTKIIYLFPYETEIEDVVVTASPKEASTKESIYKIEVIDKTEIENRAANTLAEVLMNHLNIEISQSVLGSSINLQGLSGSNVKIMIDGIPVVGRLNGDIDLSQINMSNIERVEIVEGPLSVIYGSNALAGVINLITKKSQKNKLELELNTYYESVGNYNIDAQVGYKFKNHFLQLNGGRYFFDGWNDGAYDRNVSWDPKESYFGDFSYVVRTKKDWFHRIKLAYFQDRLLDRKDPVSLFTKADDIWFKTRRADAAYIINGTFKTDFYLQSTNGYNYYDRIKNTYTKDLSTLEATLKENTDFSTFQDTTILQQFTSRTFVAYNNELSKYTYQIGYDLSIETGKGEKLKDDNNKDIVMTDIAAFATFTYKPNEKLSIQPAVRYGYNSKFTSSPTLSATIKYDINKQTTVRLSYGMGYRAPTLKEMYLDFQDINHNIQGNQNLKAERSHNVSLGIEYGHTIRVHQYGLKFNGFFNHKYDGIFLSQVESTDETLFTYVNTYKYQTLGAQFDLKYKVKHFSLNSGFSYIGTYNLEKDNDADLKPFFFKPSFRLNIGYQFIKWGLNLSLFNKLVGSSWDYNVGSNGEIKAVKLDTYNLMDFTASKTFWKKRIRINAGIKNIFNVSTVNGGLSSGGSHDADSGAQISTGRTYFVGLKFSY